MATLARVTQATIQFPIYRNLYFLLVSILWFPLNVVSHLTSANYRHYFSHYRYCCLCFCKLTSHIKQRWINFIVEQREITVNNLLINNEDLSEMQRNTCVAEFWPPVKVHWSETAWELRKSKANWNQPKILKCWAASSDQTVSCTDHSEIKTCPSVSITSSPIEISKLFRC